MSMSPNVSRIVGFFQMLYGTAVLGVAAVFYFLPEMGVALAAGLGVTLVIFGATKYFEIF